MTREGRALAVSELLRLGHSGRAVSAMLKVADAGGTVVDAMAELLRVTNEERAERAARASRELSNSPSNVR